MSVPKVLAAVRTYRYDAPQRCKALEATMDALTWLLDLILSPAFSKWSLILLGWLVLGGSVTVAIMAAAEIVSHGPGRGR